MDPILPIIHRNGTSREALLEQCCAAGRALRQAIDALAAMAPNGRDYYPKPGLMEAAVGQHHRRSQTLLAPYQEIQAQAERIANEEG